MKNKNLFMLISFVGICFFALACANSNKKVLPNPKIQLGKATLSGKIIRVDKNSNFILSIPNPVTMDIYQQEIKLDDSLSFSIEIPLETNPAIGFIYNTTTEDGFIINFEADKETKINIENKSISVVSGPDFYTENSTQMSEAFIKAAQSAFRRDLLNKNLIDSCIENPQRYVPINQYDINKRLELITKDSLLSEQSKIYLNYYLKSHQIVTPLQFSEDIKDIWKSIQEKGDTTTLRIKEPGLSYYTFLKEYDLGNPLYLYSESYGRIFQTILRNETFNIPDIGETPISEWISGVTKTMSRLIGTDTGLFYDMIIAEAYMRQLSYRLESLSNKQQQNIKDYFADAEIAKILLNKNEEITKLTVNKGKTNINETPKVSKEKVLQTIIEKYKGNVVLVDFWATWCGPCIAGMKKILPLKNEMAEKNIVFVYITNNSSPLKLWEERLKGIDGEHYYLADEEWEYIMHKIKSNGIPTYLIYDKNGVQKNNYTGYPGTETLKKNIEDLF